jgi:RNA polymerase sigma-70 factor (ECF subfamily)
MAQPSTTAAACPSFEELYEEYNGPLTRYTTSRLHGVSDEEVQDRVSDVWLKIYQNYPSKWRDQGLPIGAWLFSIMRNAIIDWLRASRGRTVVQLDPAVHDPADDASESEVLAVLSGELMDEIIAVLDEREGDIIRLIYVDGWRLTDAAQRYGETLDATKKRHRRALGRVRTYLETGATRKRRRARLA